MEFSRGIYALMLTYSPQNLGQNLPNYISQISVYAHSTISLLSIQMPNII